MRGSGSAWTGGAAARSPLPSRRRRGRRDPRRRGPADARRAPPDAALPGSDRNARSGLRHRAHGADGVAGRTDADAPGRLGADRRAHPRSLRSGRPAREPARRGGALSLRPDRERGAGALGRAGGPARAGGGVRRRRGLERSLAAPDPASARARADRDDRAPARPSARGLHLARAPAPGAPRRRAGAHLWRMVEAGGRDERGARFWIYRAGDGADPATGSGRWFLHGFFG